MATTEKRAPKRVLAQNKKARHDYHILDTWEAGLALEGTEVKAIRQGKIQLKDSHVQMRNGQAFLVGVHVSPYSHGNRENHLPERPRKLLLHQREIDRLAGQLQVKGLTAVPLQVYTRGPWIKVEIGLAKGKKLHDKRRVMRERELDKEAREAMKRARQQMPKP